MSNRRPIVRQRAVVLLACGLIAIRPLKDYTIDINYTPAEAFDVVRSAFAQTGFVFDIATQQEFATFEAFQRAVNQNPPVVDWDQLSVAYTNVRGETLTATWNPPNYDVPEGERVLVRPDITVNGVVVPIDTTYPVLKSPSVELVDRVLRLRTPAGQLEADWRGKMLALSNQSLPLPSRADAWYAAASLKSEFLVFRSN